MSDRLAELLRQKQLLQEHLNWLDQEIARTATSAVLGTPPPPSIAKPAPAVTATPPPETAANTPVAQVVPPVPPAAPAPKIAPTEPSPSAPDGKSEDAMRMADEILARYQQEEAIRPEDTKRGCIVLASAIFVILAAIFLVTYVLFYRSHQ